MSATAPPAPPPARPTRQQLTTVNSAVLALTSLFVAARLVVRLSARRPFEKPDLFIYFAFALFVAMWGCLMQENVPLFKVESLQRGEIPFYPEVIHDAAMIYRYMTAAQICFYSSLLTVKLSLLTLYLRLLERTPAVYKKIWWGILVFCCLAWFGALLSTLFVCDSNDAKYNRGSCAAPHEIRRSIISLWFAYAVDVLSDLLVMFLPFRLTWNLQMPRVEKVGVFMLFGTGWVLILFSTLRVVRVGLANGVPSTPDTKWLEMWTIIETSVAVIIGCCPAFAALVKRTLTSLSVSYNSRGYVKGSRANSIIKMRSRPSRDSKSKQNTDTPWAQEHGSREELAQGDARITPTTSVQQDEERPPDVPKGYVRKIPTTIR